MYLLKVQLKFIEFIESMAQYLPPSIASWVKLLMQKWRDKVNVQIVQEAEKVKINIKLLRKEISEMQSAARKIKGVHRRKYRDDKY